MVNTVVIFLQIKQMKISLSISTTSMPKKIKPQQTSEHLPLTEEVQRLVLDNTLDPIIVRTTVRKLADSLGYSLLDQVRISTAIFEIAQDYVAYAGKGEIIVSWRKDTTQLKGLHFFCHDCGLNDPKLTTILLAGGSETHNKLNFLGLRRLVDEFTFTQDPEYGNCVTVIKWIEPQ